MTSSFTIHAQPDTDTWRKPPSTNAFNSTVEALSEHTNKPLSSFQGAAITVSADWTAQYDQGGILLHVTKPGIPCHGSDLNQPQDSKLHSQCKWIKSGIEFYNGATMISTVCCDNYADWSVLPVSATSTKLNEVTIELRREKDQNGKGLWLYQILNDESGKEIKKVPLREVAWLFAYDEEWSVSVGGYACRPASADAAKQAGSANDTLEVKLTNLVVDFSSS